MYMTDTTFSLMTEQQDSKDAIHIDGPRANSQFQTSTTLGNPPYVQWLNQSLLFLSSSTSTLIHSMERKA